MIAHSNLGASGAHRWIACPGQPRFTESQPREVLLTDSVYASEGTAAHALGEACLRRGVPAHEYLGRVIDSREGVILAHGAPKSIADGIRYFLVGSEMALGVQTYLDEVTRQRRQARVSRLFVEQRVQPFLDRTDMFGTADAIVHEDWGRLSVTDLKYGFKPVSPEYNAQGLYYALGAMNTIGPAADDVPEVEIVIAQPRVGDGTPKRWVTTPEEVREFGDVLRSAADRTREPDAPLVAGDHCLFCPARAVCPAREAKHKADVQLMFDQAPAIVEPNAPMRPIVPVRTDPGQVARALAAVPLIDDWIKAVHTVAWQLAQAGIRVEDPVSDIAFKLVRGRGSRSWEDEEKTKKEAEAEATALGVSPTDLYTEPKFRSPAQLEDIFGRKWVADRHRKVPGSLTLVLASDPRDEVVIAPPQFPALPEGPTCTSTDLDNLFG